MCLLATSPWHPVQIVLEIPDSDAITRADAQSIQALEPLIESRSELVAIALWLMRQEVSRCHTVHDDRLHSL